MFVVAFFLDNPTSLKSFLIHINIFISITLILFYSIVFYFFPFRNRILFVSYWKHFFSCSDNSKLYLSSKIIGRNYVFPFNIFWFFITYIFCWIKFFIFYNIFKFFLNQILLFLMGYCNKKYFDYSHIFYLEVFFLIQ